MSRSTDAAKRDALLARMGVPDAEGQSRPDTVPLDWDDIAVLSHGLIFGNRPMLRATKGVTERHSLGPRGGWMLSLIAGGLVHPHELSNVLKIGRSLVSAELARLSEAGLVTSQPGASDKRRSKLALTALGEAARAEIHADLFHILTSALDSYSPSHIRLMARMLHDLHAAVAASPD